VRPEPLSVRRTQALTDGCPFDILLTMLGTPIRDRQTERREATCAEILDAAWALAREKGLAGLTLRDVATQVGMQAPSLYSYFASKNAIYDAMFGQAWSDYLNVITDLEPTLPKPPRARLKAVAHTFFDFAVADPIRYQLMNERPVPGFVPSAEAYAPAVQVVELARRDLPGLGMKRNEDFDLFTAIVGGLINAQQANEPGGDRWAKLLDDAVDMFADHLGLPAAPGSRRRTR
jgi:AcrR family transcriptional regulator